MKNVTRIVVALVPLVALAAIPALVPPQSPVQGRSGVQASPFDGLQAARKSNVRAPARKAAPRRPANATNPVGPPTGIGNTGSRRPVAT